MTTKARKREAAQLRDASDTAYRNYLEATAASVQKARDYLAAHVELVEKLMSACEGAGVRVPTHQDIRDRRHNMVRELEPMQRALLAPYLMGGLGGQALDRWIGTGATSREQQVEDEGIRAAQLASEPRPVRQAAPPPDAEPGERTYSATQIATKLGADPREFRAMLRKRGLTKSSYTKADAKVMAQAWRREQS